MAIVNDKYIFRLNCGVWANINMCFRKKYQLVLPLAWIYQWGRWAEVIYLSLLFGVAHALDHERRKRLYCDILFYYWSWIHIYQTCRASKSLCHGKPLQQQGGRELLQRPFLVLWFCTVSTTILWVQTNLHRLVYQLSFEYRLISKDGEGR